MPRFLLALLCVCSLAVRTASADPAPPDRSANPFFAFGAALEHVEAAYVVPLPRGRLLAQALQGLGASGIPFDAKQRRALQDDLRAVASAPDERQRFLAFGAAVERVIVRLPRPGAAERVAEAAIRAMVGGLDPHSRYQSPSELAAAQVASRDSPGGIGLELADLGGAVTAVRPLPGSPAERAGLRPGDVVLSIEGRPVAGLALAEVIERLRGPAGRPVVLAIRRPGDKDPSTLTIAREVVRPLPLRWALFGGVAYLRLEAFDGASEARLRRVLQEATERAGGRLDGLVLDLRDNGGGLFDPAAAVAGLFLPAGSAVVTLKGRAGNERDNRTVTAGGGDPTGGAPMVVVVNGRTAAGAEVVAGALRDGGRAVVLGGPTFGHGTLQTVISLGEGKGALTLTTARFHLPSGRGFQRVGIVPDVPTYPAKASLAAALQDRREADLPGSLPAEGEAPDTPARGDLAPIRARIPVSPPAGDPAPDPARPDADFEVRQAVRVLSLLRAPAPVPAP